MSELKYPQRLGQGCQPYDTNDLDSRGAANTIAVFENQIWPSIKKYFSKDSTLIDVGCGNGRFAAFFSDIVESVFAIDPFREINPHNLRKNVSFSNISLQDLDTDAIFDIAYYHGTFYLMKNWSTDDAFRKTLGMLSENGLLIIVDDKIRDKGMWPRSKTAVTAYDVEELCTHFGGKIIDSFIIKNGVLRVTVIKKV